METNEQVISGIGRNREDPYKLSQKMSDMLSIFLTSVYMSDFEKSVLLKYGK